jgi:hypothetical protein
VTTIALRMRFVLVTKRYLGKMTILVVAIHGRWTNPRTRDESPCSSRTPTGTVMGS